jgi:hypothetical protein
MLSVKSKGIVSNVKKILSENPDITDTQFEDELYKIKSKPLFVPFAPMFDFESIIENVNHRFRKVNQFMNKELRDMELDDSKVTEPIDPTKPQVYSKFIGSVTTLNDKGEKETKTITNFETVRNGKRHVYKKMIKQDANGKIIEETLPTGNSGKYKYLL